MGIMNYFMSKCSIKQLTEKRNILIKIDNRFKDKYGDREKDIEALGREIDRKELGRRAA